MNPPVVLHASLDFLPWSWLLVEKFKRSDEWLMCNTRYQYYYHWLFTRKPCTGTQRLGNSPGCRCGIGKFLYKHDLHQSKWFYACAGCWNVTAQVREVCGIHANIHCAGSHCNSHVNINHVYNVAFVLWVHNALYYFTRRRAWNLSLENFLP